MNAQEIIFKIVEAGAIDATQIQNVLMDGEALDALGIHDQESVEEAFDIISGQV